MISEERMKRIVAAVELVKGGEWAKVQPDDDTKVYRVKDVIRIDIKEESI